MNTEELRTADLGPHSVDSVRRDAEEWKRSRLMTPALLPCPFCGGASYFTKAVNGSLMAYVGCSPCGVSMKAQTHGYGDDVFPLSRDIVTAWNTRVSV